MTNSILKVSVLKKRRNALNKDCKSASFYGSRVNAPFGVLRSMFSVHCCFHKTYSAVILSAGHKLKLCTTEVFIYIKKM